MQLAFRIEINDVKTLLLPPQVANFFEQTSNFSVLQLQTTN